MPTDEEIEKQFEDFMEEKQFKPEVRANMRKLANSAKWKLLCQEKFTKSNADGANSDPVHWANQLKNNIALKGLASLEIVLRSQGKSWMQKFVEEDGINSLLALLAIPR